MKTRFESKKLAKENERILRMKSKPTRPYESKRDVNQPFWKRKNARK